jgi:hypothetical protein
MQTVRRLYLYLISGVTLTLVATGLTLLGDALLAQLGFGRGTFIGGDPAGSRVQLSQAVALIGVGLPVWVIHWWLVERGLQPGNPTHEAERSSPVRAVYLSLVLAVALLVGVNSAASLVRSAGHALAGVGPNFDLGEPTIALPTAIVGGLVWLYHWLVRRRDLRVGPLSGAAAWVPRLYIYGVAALGLSSALGAVNGLFLLAADVLTPAAAAFDDPGFRRVALVDTTASVVTWGAVWLGHWWYAVRATRGTEPQAVGEALSRVRTAYLVGIFALGSAQALIDLIQAGRALLIGLLGAESILGVQTGTATLAREVVVPVLTALVWAAVAWLHLRWARREADRPEEPERPARVERLASHALSLVGLGFGAAGLAWLIGLALDVAFGGGRTIGGGGYWRVELSQFAPMAVLGLAVWLWSWRQVLGRYGRDPEAEARSTTRRGALLLTMAGAVLAGLSGAALVLYRLVSTLLRADVSADPVSELSTPLGVLSVAVAVAAYHGLLLRSDLAVRAAGAEAMPEAPAPVEALEATAVVPATGAPATAPTTRRLVLSGPPGADLDAIVASLRAGLPSEASLDDAGP